jgi:hypothetical protein
MDDPISRSVLIMSKKNRNHQPPRQQSSNANQVKPLGSILNGLMSAVNQTTQALGSEKPEWDESIFESLNASLPEERRDQFQKVLQQFMDLGKSVQAAITKASEAESTSNAAKEKLAEEARRLGVLENEITERESQIKPRISALDDRETSLIEAQKLLEIGQANARAQFLNENNQALSQRREELSQIELQKVALLGELAKQRSEALKHVEEETAQIVRDLEQRQQEIEKASGEIEAQKANLEMQQRRLARDHHSADQLEGMIRKQLEEEMEAALRKKADENEKLRSRSNRLAEELEQVRAKLDNFNTLEIALAGRSAESLIEEANEWRRKSLNQDVLIHQLEAKNADDESVTLRKEKDLLEEELRTLRPELEELRGQSRQFRVGVLEKEQWAMERRLLHKKNELLSAHLNDLESRIQGLTEAQGKQGAFPELGRMDTEFKFNTPASVEPIANLKAFTEELRHRIAASQPGNPLYFRLEDLQLFVGGLAMSQLHVFQGISGTGKTSLAKAFAKAVGGECTDIAVQAGWRDRADLLGHYNAFEKKFYEKDCLQALYKAQTPAFSDRVNIVLLDEMNLSRPEQYFADFLSALEKEPGDRKVPLMESAPANAPKLLRDGREILLPENVWFIGTANQDETTNELADKTHDRAFVMELPRHEGQFEFNAQLDLVNYQFKSLKAAFAKAQKKEEATVRDILKFISNSELTSVLEKQFDRGWGNRFERQALKFLPVVKAAGGSFETAIDHLLATRIFRAGKVTQRYDTDKNDLSAIEKALHNTLSKIFPNIVPVRCQIAIEKDMIRLEKGA